MQEVSADEIKRGHSPQSHRPYESLAVDSLSKRVAETLRSHEHAYEKLGQELGDVVEEAKEAAGKLIAEAHAEAAGIRDKALADAAAIRDDAEADAARIRDEAEREAAKRRRAAERDAARSKKEAGGRVSHLKKLEQEARERLTSLRQELLTLSEVVQRLEPPLQEDDETTGGGDEEVSLESEASVHALASAGGETFRPSLSNAVEDRKPDAGGSDEYERAGGHEHGKGVATSVPQVVGAAAPVHATTVPQSAAPAPSIPPRPATQSAASPGPRPHTDPALQGRGHPVAPTAEFRAAPAYPRQEPMDVMWAALGAFSCLFGIVGFLVGLAITLFDQGGFVGPLLALVSFGVLGLGAWAIKTHVMPALPGLFHTASSRSANPRGPNADVRAGWQT